MKTYKIVKLKVLNSNENHEKLINLIDSKIPKNLDRVDMTCPLYLITLSNWLNDYEISLEITGTHNELTFLDELFLKHGIYYIKTIEAIIN